ncbi:MAG: beta-ketoacyl synthase chain length factor, partial [Betaproteobacteria bacterium]|nr:beta-ketoacyl synthase chain length factor [Betaproteobacteria bacterium]
FSSSVHHTPTAYFDLAAKNTLLSRTISAGESAFACAILEVSELLRKYPAVPVLLTFGDEPPPEPFRDAEAAPEFPHAVAFLFASQPAGGTVPLHFRRVSPVAHPPALPRDTAVNFLRWLTGQAAQFQLPANFGGWLCRR